MQRLNILINSDLWESSLINEFSRADEMFEILLIHFHVCSEFVPVERNDDAQLEAKYFKITIF